MVHPEQVLKNSNLPLRLRVLLALMLRFDPSGRELWPSARTLAKRLGVVTDTALRNIHELEKRGVLRRLYPANWRTARGLRRPVTYCIDLSRLTADESTAKQVNEVLRKLEA